MSGMKATMALTALATTASVPVLLSQYLYQDYEYVEPMRTCEAYQTCSDFKLAKTEGTNPSYKIDKDSVIVDVDNS